jgi:cell division protein FtsZ
MLSERVRGVDFIACNTDAQALRRSRAPRKLRIGHDITGGLGSGGDPEVGRRSAEDDADRISGALEGADLVFVTAGLGGGTGSGAAPVVAAKAREQGALTIGVVTKPFGFEGSGRERIAEEAAHSLMSQVDALIAIPNDRMSDVVQDDATMLDAFRVVDGVLLQGIEGILQLLDKPELINLDFADIRAVLQHAGPTLIGLGRGSGERRAADAARQAVSSPLLEAKIDGARTILFNVSGPADLQLREVREAADEIRAAADPNATVIFGAGFGEPVGDDVRITLIATGLGGSPPVAESAEERADAQATRDLAPTPRARRATKGTVPTPSGSRASRGRKVAAAEPLIDAEAAEPAAPAGAARPRSVLDDDEYEVPSFLRRGTGTQTRGQS